MCIFGRAINPRPVLTFALIPFFHKSVTPLRYRIRSIDGRSILIYASLSKSIGRQLFFSFVTWDGNPKGMISKTALKRLKLEILI